MEVEQKMKKSKIIMGLLVLATLLLMTVSSVNAVVKYREIHIGNGLCLYKNINQKVGNGPHIIKESEAWYNKKVPCKNYFINEVNLEKLGQLDYKVSTCQGQVVNGVCTQIVGGLDGRNYLSNPDYKDQHNNAGTTVNRHPIKKYVCRWEFIGEKAPEETSEE
jgi:hypothetical protein